MHKNEKHWVAHALGRLDEALNPIPHESNELDWKLTLSDKKERLTEHLIAFANTSAGGYLVFGISNDGLTKETITQEKIESIVNTLANLGRDSIEPPLVLDHAIVEYKAAFILIVYISSSPNKPVHKRGKSIEEAWIRSGATTRKASRQEIGALMLHSFAPKWEELRATSLITFNEVRAKLDIGILAKLLLQPIPQNDHELSYWLTQQGLICPDNQDFYITNLGAIALANELEHFDSLKRKRIRVVRYKGTNKVETIDEITGQRGYASSFERLISYLKRVLPHSEIIQQSLRQEVCIYPELALRELLANTLIHQDFSISGTGPMIEIFDDRIEFTNPGSLLPGKRLDRLIGTPPQSRNEKLASAFRLYRICEERGTGFQKVVDSVELFGLPPIKFTPLDNAFKVTLYGPRSFSEMSQDERIEATYQHAVLQHLSSQTLTNTSLRKRFKLHDKQRNQITNLIADAVSSNKIKRKDTDGGNKFAEYLPYWV